MVRTKVDDLPSRLKLIYAGVIKSSRKVPAPDYFVIEQVFMAKNADSASLGQARGVAIVAAVNQELPRCLNTRRVR